jgi:recombination protein RecT
MGNKVMSLRDMDAWFTGKSTELAERIGSLGVDPVRMTRLALLAMQGNNRLLKCSPSSIFVALMEAASLHLEPTLGHAYLVPYGKSARLQIGYRGLIELAQRSGMVGAVSANMVYERDKFDWQEGTGGFIAHERFVPEITKDPIHLSEAELEEMSPGFRRMAYAVVHLIAGGPPAFDVMTIPEIEAIRRRAASFNASSSPWITDYDAMAQKTVLRRTLWRRVRSSVELQAAMQMDSSLEGGTPQRLYEIDDKFSGLRDVASAVGHQGEEEPDYSGPDEKGSKADKLAEDLGGGN